MGKRSKTWLIITASFILAGGVIFVGVMSLLNWDFTKLSANKYETNAYAIVEQYQNITVATDTANITFVASEDVNTKIVCYEQKNAKHTVLVEDDTLVITLVDTRKWYEHIGINFGTPKITVYLPQGEYGALSVKGETGDVEIPKDIQLKSLDVSQSTGDVMNYASVSEAMEVKTSTGDILIADASAEMMDLSVSTGKITLSDIKCEKDVKITVSTGKTNVTNLKCNNIISKGSTGDISLENVFVAEKMTVVRSTGDIKLSACDAAEIFIETDTGDVTGTLLSEKVFIADTDTGCVDVPKTATGGKCEITTDTGDTKIKIG